MKISKNEQAFKSLLELDGLTIKHAPKGPLEKSRRDGLLAASEPYVSIRNFQQSLGERRHVNRQTDGLIVSQPIKGFYPPVYKVYRQVRKEDLKRDGRNICIAQKEMFYLHLVSSSNGVINFGPANFLRNFQSIMVYGEGESGEDMQIQCFLEAATY